jgi:hypothetical protein
MDSALIENGLGLTVRPSGGVEVDLEVSLVRRQLLSFLSTDHGDPYSTLLYPCHYCSSSYCPLPALTHLKATFKRFRPLPSKTKMSSNDAADPTTPTNKKRKRSNEDEEDVAAVEEQTSGCSCQGSCLEVSHVVQCC